MRGFEDYILSFQKWCEFDGKAASGPKYVGYLSCLNKPFAEPTHSTWNGLYAYLYGHPAGKEVVQIESKEEYDRLFGGLRRIFSAGECPSGANAEHYAQAVRWAQSPEVRGPSCLCAAMNAYEDFLEWLSLQGNVLGRFRVWLSYPERNHGKGYKASTIDRYVEAMSAFDNVLSGWGIDLGGRKLHQVTNPAEFATVEARIRACPEFASYNGNRNAEGQCRNLNGTGWGDPSAALTQFRLYLETGAEKEPDAANVVFDISAAVKLFTTHRLDEDWVKVLKRDGYEGLHERYAAMNPETLRGMNAAEFDAWVDRELWAARTFFCGQNIKKLSDADKKAFCEFIAATKKNFRLMSNYLGKEAKLPNGVGPVVATELLMKFHPLDYCNYNVLMLQGLKVLGLVESDKMPNVVSVAMYQKLMGHAAMLLEKLTDAGAPRRFDEGPDAKPDYITVNEFLWWCKEHQDLIKEEMMKQNQIKAEPEKLKTNGAKKLSDLIAGGPDSLMTMLTAALLAKPFAILAGASGTGKSRMVKKLAYMTCNADQLRNEKDETPGNYCMIAVKPNWHDSSELLGYRSAISESHEYITPDFIKFILRAHAFPKTPFFVCLDEMNLAPVEQYFAEFLSACESIRKNSDGEWVSDPLIQPGEFDKNVANLAPDYSLPDACIKRINERGLYIPHNLFVVGTVNMDDTTHQFSRKVLDRAMTLMMDDVDFGTLQDAQYERLTNDLLMNGPDIAKFIDRGEFEGKDLERDFKELLGKLQTALKESPFAIGYRFAIESVLYRKALALLGIEAAALDATAADHMALMKILPRITGTLEERDAVLKNLADFFGALGEHKQSGDRLEKMKTAATQNGDYISFWP